MADFPARVAQAAEQRAARTTAASGAGLVLLATGVGLLALLQLVGREVIACVRGGWWAVRTVPALARVLLGLVVVFWVLRDPWFAIPLTTALVGLLAYPRINPGSFRAQMAGPARAVAIRRAWPGLARACGLGVKTSPRWDNRPRLRTAKLRKASSTAGGVTTRLEVATIPGQTPTDVTEAAEKLAAATDSVDWVITPAGPSRVVIDLVGMDVLAATLPARMPTEPVAAAVPDRLTVGLCLSGSPWRLTTAAHTLTAGCTGSGKGSVMWSTLTALAPAIHTGVIRVAGIDLKGGMELGTGRDLFTRLATTPEDAVTLLEDVSGIMTTRAARLAGVERCHSASVGDPAWLIVVDEMAVLTAYLPDRDLKTRAVRALSLLLTQGRAVGVTVWAFLQDPGKDVLSLRDLFTQRVCLRMTEPTGAVMVLGDAARDSAPAHRISPDAPGTGYALAESGTLQRVRATYVTDGQIRYLAANFPAPTSTVLDSTVQDGAVIDGPASDGNVRPLRDAEASAVGRCARASRSSRSPRKPRAPRAPWPTRFTIRLDRIGGHSVSGLDWMASAACAAQPRLPWTAEPGTYPDVLVGVMANLCAQCDVRDVCAAYAAEDATAGFWAGSRRTHPDEPAQPELPLDDVEDAAAA